jgi:hypothetical protein
MLAGCAGTTFSQIPSDVAAFITEVQQTTAALCVVEPTAASIATLISASAVVGTAAAVAGAICDAVKSLTPVSAKRQRFGAAFVPPPVIINGVQVTFEPIGTMSKIAK